MKKPLTLFDWLKEITYNKGEWDSFSSEDKKTFNIWMVNKFLSMNQDYIELVNMVQKYNFLDDKQVYTLYKNIIPKRNVFLKFIKGKKDKNNNEELVYLAQYFGCSIREVKDYINLLSKDDVKDILDNFSIKTTKKKV
jgi:hypothetical protein